MADALETFDELIATVAPPVLFDVDTDVRNAHRFVAQHGQDVRFCWAWNRWLVWDGRRWSKDAAGEILRRAEQTAAAIYYEAAEAASAAEKKLAQKLAKWAHTSQSRTRLDAMVYLTRHQPGIPVQPVDLDADPWLLNCLNGTLDLRTCELRPHRREDMLTRLVPVEYDHAAEAPTWEAFLRRVMAGNDELIDFLRRAVGYSLTGSTREQVFFLLYGTGRNGKSTFLDVLLRLFGDYGKQTRFDSFLARDSERVNNDLAALAGARLVVASEAGEGKRFDEALVKAVTGGDRVVARFLYSEFFEYTPVFKLWLAANHKPAIRGTDLAIWRRVLLVPFGVTIPAPDDERYPPEERADPELADTLLAELPGILAWAVRGCLEWQREGLRVPPEVRAATQAYRDEMDILAAFIEDCCVVDPRARAGAGDLYRAYCGWCEDVGERPVSQREFGLRLRERGFQKIKAGHENRVIWQGIGLAANREAEEAAITTDPTDWSWWRPDGGR